MPTPLVVVPVSSLPPRSATGPRTPLSEALNLLSVEAGEALILASPCDKAECLESWILRFGSECGAQLVGFDCFESRKGSHDQMEVEREYRELLMPLAPAWGPPEFFPSMIRSDFERRKVRSVVLLPMAIDGGLWGMCRLEFETVRLDYTLEDISAMTRVVRILAAAVRAGIRLGRRVGRTEIPEPMGMTRREFLEAEARMGAEQLIQSCLNARSLFRQADFPEPEENAGYEVDLQTAELASDDLTTALADLSAVDMEIWSSAVEALDGLFTEISGHCEKHRKLKGVLEETWRIEETEKEEISRNLHERLAQDISSSKLLCDLVKQSLPENRGDLVEGMEKISGVLKKSVDALRNIAYRLHPPDLQELGLEQALQMLCLELGAKGGMRIRFSPIALEHLQLSPEAGIQVYRAVEEVLLSACEGQEVEEIRFMAAVQKHRLTLRFETPERLYLPERAEQRIRLLGGRIRQAGKSRPAIVLELPVSRMDPLEEFVTT